MKKLRADLEEGEEITTPSQVLNLFVDLTDSTRLNTAMYAPPPPILSGDPKFDDAR